MKTLLVETASNTSLISRPVSSYLLVKCLLYRDKAHLQNELGFVKKVGVEIAITLLTVAALVETAVRTAILVLSYVYCPSRSLRTSLITSMSIGFRSVVSGMTAIFANIFSSETIFVNSYASKLYDIEQSTVEAAMPHLEFEAFSTKNYYESLEDDFDSSAAYYVLSDSTLKDLYDEYGEAGVKLHLLSEKVTRIWERSEDEIKELLSEENYLQMLKEKASQKPRSNPFDDFFGGSGPDAPPKNLYGTLGLSKTASAEEIKKVYRQLALTWHPDKNNNSEEAKAKFQEIGEAYEILSNPTKKMNFDRFGIVN